MNKCVGCGAILQDTNIDEVGYVKNLESKLCERCFKIKNYGEYKPVIKESDEFVTLLQSINSSGDLVILVCDLFNFNPNMDLIKKYIHNDIILVLTKRDILPNDIYEDKLLNYINSVNLNIVDRIIISSMNNYHFDEMFTKINQYKKSNNVYVIGYTNAGKSTMINKILYNYATKDTEVTTSILPNTTIDKIDIKINDDLTLIDTPGLLDNGSIYYLKNVNELKKITPKKTIKPRTYQVKTPQSFIVDDLFRLDVKHNDITFYIANNLDITRVYKAKDSNLEKHVIKVNRNQDIVIKGIGFVKFMKSEEVTIYTIKGIEVYNRNSLI